MIDEQNRDIQPTCKKNIEENEKITPLQAEKLVYIGGATASIIHDINTPLTCIGGFLQLYLKLLQQPDISIDRLRNAQSYLERALSETKRCQNLVHDLLVFVHQGKQIFTEVSLYNLFQNIIDLLGEQLYACNVTLDIFCEQWIVIEGNEDQLQQVFTNLIMNAKNAMPQGGSITIHVKSKADTIEIVVSDTGIGISENNLSQIFEPFFTTRSAGKGTGLGLAICKQIIQEHGGTINVESILNQGTTFIITLPKNVMRNA